MSGLSEEVWRGDGDKVLCGERERSEVESTDSVPRAQVGILLLLPLLHLLLNIHLIPT